MQTATASKKSQKTKFAASEPNYKAMTTGELWSKVDSSLAASAEHMYVAAKCVGQLKRRGVDVSRLGSRLLRTLDKIDDGTLSPDAATAFSSSPMVLDRVAKLPIKKQEELVKNPIVSVYRGGTTGESVVSIPLNRLNKHEVTQVFGDGKVRTLSEQVESLKPTAPTEKQPMRWVTVPLNQAEWEKASGIAAKDDIAMCELFRRAARSKGWI